MALDNIGLALGVGGSLALLAAPFTGGASLYVYGAGIAALGASAAIGLTAAQPEPISQVARQIASTSDEESPWEWVYGTVVKGAAVPWTGIGGDDDQYTGADYVIACHACDAVLDVQVGDWTFPLVTSVDGDTNYNGLGLILNTGLAVDPNVFPADWYVPVKGGANGDSPWWRNPQDDKNTSDRPHIGLKIYYGTQTATDTHMASRFGTKYSSVARKFVGHTVAHVIVRVHTELGTMGGMPEVVWRLRGKKDIQDYTGGNAAYRNNAAYVFADYLREQQGRAVTSIVGVNSGQTLQGVAAECDDTTWAGSGSAPRYTFDGVIRDDVKIIDALKMITEHMAGGYSERGDQIALFTGTVKTAWSGGPITEDDLAGDDPVRIFPPKKNDWANTLVPHFVKQRPNDENGQRVLHGAMAPTAVDVTSSTYVTEDGGVTIRKDIKFPACILSRRAKWLAWTALKQMRLGSTMTIRLKKRCTVLEIGDVFAANLPNSAPFFPNGTKWQVVGKRDQLGPNTFAVELDCVRYEDDIYTPGTTPTEDAIGIVPRNRSSIMPLITGLAADEVPDSSSVNRRGKLTVSVAVTWNLVSNILVRNAGNIRIAWKRDASITWYELTTAGDAIQAIIPAMRQGTLYNIRARAEGTPSAGRTDVPVGRWSAAINFTPDSGDPDLPGPPGSGIEGSNQVPNGNFEDGPNSIVWDLVDETADLPSGAAEIETTGGKYGPHMLEIQGTASAANQFYRVRNDVYLPVSAGEWKFCRVAVRKGVGSPDIRAKVVAIFYDTSLSVISSLDVITEDVSATSFPESRYGGRVQVPGDNAIVWVRLQLRHQSLSTGFQQSYWDGVTLHDMTVMRGDRQTTQINRTDDTWTELAMLDDFPGGPNADAYFDGETSITVTAYVYASVQHTTSTKLTATTRAVARVRLEEVGVGTTTIIDQTLIARMQRSETDTGVDDFQFGSGDSTEVEIRRLETTLTPTVGHYKIYLEGRMLGDGTNGRAQFHDRWIRIVKD